MGIIEKIEEKKMKGYLTTRQRIVFEGGIYHITQRAPGREVLFIEDGDYLYLLKLLKETVKKYDLALYAFALLPNHLHLLLSIQERNLSQAMKKLFERYAIYFNKKYERKGHVFCGRYRASLCNDANYFLAASIYIHLNAYRAGLCENVDDYRWHSLGLYQVNSRKSFVNPRKVLSTIDSDIEKAQVSYFEILKEGMRTRGGNSQDIDSVIKNIRQMVFLLQKIFSDQSTPPDLEQLIADYSKRRRIVNPQDKKARKYLIQQLFANGYSHQEIMQKLSLSKSSLYRITH